MTVSVRTLLLFYRRHLRVQPVRELMAIAGVAAGVALLFAVQIANNSITGAFNEVVHGVAGRATLEVASRSPEGFSQAIYQRVQRTPGVRRAAPVLTQQVVIVGARASRALTLVGADPRLGALGGELVVAFERYAEASPAGLLALTQPTASAIGARRGREVAIRIDGLTQHLYVAAVVPSARLGALTESPVAAAPLPVVQALAGLPGRITRILVEPAPGRESQARRALTQTLGADLNVRAIDSESRLLSNAAKPEGQLTALFSAISLVVGVILAYNALLLASGERREFIAYLIQLGATDATIVASLMFDALILGIAGSIVGLLVGDAVSLLAYGAPPGYLTAAFPIGGQRILDARTILITLTAGILAAFAAAALPAVGSLRGNVATINRAGRTLLLLRKSPSSEAIVFGAGALLVCASIAASLIWPAVVVVALVAFAAGLVLCLPTIVRYILALARSTSRRSGDPSARLASGELQSSPTRSIALVATGTIAVFLTMTIGGSVADVQRAVRLGAQQTGSSGDLWVKPGGAENIYGTQPFDATGTQKRLQRLEIVRTVLAYRQSFLDMPERRVWVIGIPPRAQSPVAESQLVHGSAALAAQRLREGGWAVISQTIASREHLHVGQLFELPTPSGDSSFRLAATISNYGWLPGTVLLAAGDYSRLWHTTRASQLAITLKPGIPAVQAKLAIEHALPRGSALTVQSAAERQSQISAVLGNTLTRLNQTSTAVLIAAIATVIAMMISAVWQRRGRLDALQSIGMSRMQLSRLIFYESGCVLLTGCLIGMISGNLGQYLIDRWTQHSAGSPVQFTPAWQVGLRTVAIAILISIAAATIAVVRTAGLSAQGSILNRLRR
jgi:putative ABC transport system permease protein